jgi:hypothetical protein
MIMMVTAFLFPRGRRKAVPKQPLEEGWKLPQKTVAAVVAAVTIVLGILVVPNDAIPLLGDLAIMIADVQCGIGVLTDAGAGADGAIHPAVNEGADGAGEGLTFRQTSASDVPLPPRQSAPWSWWSGGRRESRRRKSKPMRRTDAPVLARTNHTIVPYTIC